MKADFSGYATKAGIRCTDGRTIMPGAFKDQHMTRIPLVWQHGHKDPENVLGHVLLEDRDDGVYAYGFFNDTPKGQHTKTSVQHKDLTALSIWANHLREHGGRVMHGVLREVSLVLAGANPGAVIEKVTLRHSDGSEEDLEDDYIIHSGENFDDEPGEVKDPDEKEETKVDTTDDDSKDDKSDQGGEGDESVEHADGDADGPTVQEVYDDMTEEQQTVVHFLIGEALKGAEDEGVMQSDTNENKDNVAVHGADNTEGKTMNVFEKDGKGASEPHVISHDDMESLLKTAKRMGSLHAAVEEYGAQHGINDIDVLFPDAKAITDTPEWNKRRTEWVATFLGGVHKTPFAKIKTVYADITMEEARAKGYITGNLKKEEFFSVAKRETSPTTIYKKQALDRDDVLDITDFDVVAWLKGEMRLMLDEEIARAALIGDGRDIASEDKINEQNIRPIASDHELYTTVVNVNVSDASSSMLEVSDAILVNRYKMKGTGQPTLFTTEYWLARFLMTRDLDNKRMWRNVDELATELRVAAIVPVEVMMEDPTLIGVLVNPADYNMGTNQGGQVSFFDDFDIDYNKQKYLIETRLSGALTRLKSAMVLRSMEGDDVLAVPAAPTFDPETGALTIVNTTGVVYKHGVTVVNAAGSPYTVDPGDTWVIDATPASGYYFATSDDDQWSFTADA